MIKYDEKEILKIAKRINNKKRSYLLVNPIQAKHIPVSPSVALDMMSELGNRIKSVVPETNLVIGFAETATAIGGMVALSLSENCNYIQTTRENVFGVNDYVFFSEEHSHATEQKLVSDNLEDLFSSTKSIILVDDEFSTGKTLLNIVNKLKEKFPQIQDKRIVAASVINRLSDDNMKTMSENKIDMIYLLKIDNNKYVDSVNNISPAFPVKIGESKTKGNVEFMHHVFSEPRKGISVSSLYENSIQLSNKILKKYNMENKSVLVLGTEECMLPALFVGREIEKNANPTIVRSHATTRSPIGVLNENDYPIKTGYQIKSFYDKDRTTFIYNEDRYDFIFIITDAPNDKNNAFKDIVTIFQNKGCRNFIFIGG